MIIWLFENVGPPPQLSVKHLVSEGSHKCGTCVIMEWPFTCMDIDIMIFNKNITLYFEVTKSLQNFKGHIHSIGQPIFDNW